MLIEITRKSFDLLLLPTIAKRVTLESNHEEHKYESATL